MANEASIDIRKNDILHRTETVNLSSFEEIRNRLEQRSALFTSRLAAISRFTGRGVEHIELDKHNMVVKRPADRYPKDLFTGQALCIVASHAVRDGLRGMVNPESFVIATVGLKTDFQAERWGDIDHKPKIGEHDIVEITEAASGAVMYVDPTYAQVDHRTAGKIAVFPDAELEKKYLNPLGNVFDTMTSFSEDEDILAFDYLKQTLGITDAMYRSLVDTIAR
jgi:hypothetical protein